MLPETPCLASASRLGVLAASSSVGPPGSMRQPAQAVGHEHHDLRVVLDVEHFREILGIHYIFPYVGTVDFF